MKKPSKDFSTRYSAAKRWRSMVEPDIKDVLRFCSPGREADFNNNSSPSKDPLPEIFTSMAEELAGDLASDLVTYYTPPEVRWADWVVNAPIPQDQAKAVKALVQAREDEVFELIEGSNYYDVAPQVFFEPATHGTAAMWVEQGHLTQPIYVEPVLPHELFITPGHKGHLDRFREKWVTSEFLEAQFAGQDVDLSDPKLKEKMKKPGVKSKVVWGFWLDWSEPAEPKWLHEITVDGHLITQEKTVLGPLAGSCPLLVGRFNPRAQRPWARGPGLKMLPEILTLDGVSERVMDNLDNALDPTYIYPDDGVLDVGSGIERGMSYPVRPGHKDPVQKLDLGGNLDYGWFSKDELRDVLEKGFYQDGPRQRGDTPPSATQWLDEARRVQKRIGKPSAPMWSEMIYPFIQRVEYLGVQAGKIDETISHAGHKLSITPISPLQKAQNQDKVLITRSNLDMIFSVAGEATGQVVDLNATMNNIVEASGDELIVLRDPEGGENGVTVPEA